MFNNIILMFCSWKRMIPDQTENIKQYKTEITRKLFDKYQKVFLNISFILL